MSLKLGSQLVTLGLVIFLIFVFKDFLNQTVIKNDTKTRRALNAALNGQLSLPNNQRSGRK